LGPEALYLKRIGGRRESRRSHIVGLYPEAEMVISYQVPTYKVGRGRVSLGLWKDGVSLYTTDP
jgi:hypothetical protein